MTDKKTDQMLEEIRSYLKKKDYYEILGVTKSADDTLIKNAYRKLALRFHPDKNKVEGSKQVFKKVSNAYSTLIDAEKRANYDRYGPEQTVQAQRQQYYAQQRQQYANEDEQFEFIFRQFFGGGGAMFYQPQQHHRMNHQQYRERQQAGVTNMKWMLLFLFLLILVPRFFQSKPEYNERFTTEYNTMKTTSILKNKFYVRPDFSQVYKDKPNKVLQIQRQVDYQVLRKIISQCNNAKSMKNNYDQNAAMSIFENSRTYYQQMASRVDFSSCTLLSKLQSQHPQYISQLVYLR